jgi:hypothetical protein
MLRFIINFILFGILFYLIYLFFPEAFATLVTWANKSYEFLKDLFISLGNRFYEWRGKPSGEGVPEPHALFSLIHNWM